MISGVQVLLEYPMEGVIGSEKGGRINPAIDVKWDGTFRQTY